MSPKQALESIHLPPGFHATLFAAEPEVQQPIGMTMDRRGRLWVCENYTYAERPMAWDTNLNDRVIILEDTNHDGRSDKRTVFWDQAKKLTSVLPGFGGVFALCPPQLLFLPDRNHDDVPDGPPEVLLDGFEDTVIWHNIANGLKYGPDGWIYGRQGIQGTSFVGAPGSTPEQRSRLNAGIWRFHPVTRKFEVVAEGTTNPWGTDWNDEGQLFFINTVIGHLWHVIPGAFYRRMYGEHGRTHLYELIEQTGDHFHWDTRETWNQIRETGVSQGTSEAGGGHAHSGLMIYLADNWPENYRNTLFTINFHGRRLNNDLLTREGASYTGRHGKDLLSFGDPWFRGIDLFYGPDGGVYVSDWSDTGECHNADGINRTSGRVYKITYGDKPLRPIQDLDRLSNAELLRLQLDKNDWWVRQSRQVLQERAVAQEDMKEVHQQLKMMFESQKDIGRKLRCLWALHATGGTNPELLSELLDADNEHLRVWAIQLLTENGPPAPAVLARLAQMASRDASGLVLSFIASAIRILPLEARWPLAEALCQRTEFAEDRVLPLMVWYGIEPAVPGAPDAALALLKRTEFGRVRRFIARRLSEDLEAAPLPANQVVQLLGSTPAPKLQLEILTGISEALKTAPKPGAPVAWPEVSRTLMQSPEAAVREVTQELSALFGDPQAIEQLRKLITTKTLPAAIRRKALQTLLQTRADHLSTTLSPLLDEVELAPDAIRALAALAETNVPTLLLEHYPKLSAEEARREVINALSSRVVSALALLDAVQRGEVPRDAMGPTQLRQIRSLKNEQLDARISAIWPQYDESPSGKRELYTKYKQLLTPARLQQANLSEGRHLYQLTCGLCHNLFGEGARIGPELTGADRNNLEYLLNNILEPSGIVPENYRSWEVIMKDERVLNGIILSRTEQTVTLQTISEKAVLQRSEIQSMTESKLSMMPEGLLQALNDQQACDLIAYLMSPKQVPLPVKDSKK